MGRGRPNAELILSEAENAQLTSFARSRSMPAALSQRARIVLACATGQSNTEVARRFECKRRDSRQVAPTFCEASNFGVVR